MVINLKILIIGVGKMGRYLATTLVHEKYDVTVIDINQIVLDKINNTLDISIINGNGMIVDTLLEAGVETSDIVISCMKNDEDNILVSLFAKKLGAKSTIVRVRNPKYIKSIHQLKNSLGLSMVINPEMLTAREINSTLKYSGNIKSSYLAKGKVQLLEFKLKNDSPLINLALKDIKNKLKANILVVAVERNDKVIVPNGDFIFLENDKIVVTAKHSEINLMLKEMNANYLKIKNVMIVGGSKTSYYLAKNLIEDGIKVKIIENDINKCEEISDKIPKALIINGDGSDKNLLIEEGIENMDAFVASTGIDEENVVYSMFANSINVPKVITKINHLNFSEVLENVGIDNVITPHVVASNHILRYIRAKENSIGGNMETLLRFMNEELEIMEFKVNNSFKMCGKDLKNIKFKKNLIVVCIKRKDEIIFPNGNDTLEVDDNIIVATTNHDTKGLNDILR